MLQAMLQAMLQVRQQAASTYPRAPTAVKRLGLDVRARPAAGALHAPRTPAYAVYPVYPIPLRGAPPWANAARSRAAAGLAIWYFLL